MMAESPLLEREPKDTWTGLITEVKQCLLLMLNAKHKPLNENELSEFLSDSQAQALYCSLHSGKLVRIYLEQRWKFVFKSII